MDVKSYLETYLSEYRLNRIKINAEIALQALVDDKIIYCGDCYYLRDTDGNRVGIVCEWATSENASVEKVEIHADTA